MTYTAVLDVREGTVFFLAGLLGWYLDGTWLAQLAADNRIGGSTAYRYLHEGIVGWS